MTELYPEDYGAVSGNPSVDNTSAIQTCIDAASLLVMPVRLSGIYYCGSPLFVDGSGGGGESISIIRGIGYSGSGIIFYGVTGGISSKNPLIRKMHVELSDLFIKNINADNPADGVDLSGFAYSQAKRVWSEGWNGYGFKHVIGQGMGGSAINKYYDNLAYKCGGGYLFDGAADSLFADSIIANCMAAYGTDTSKYALKIGQNTSRNRISNFTYKYASTDLLVGAIIVEGFGNVLFAPGGEVNQDIAEIMIGGSRNTVIGCTAQSASRIIDNGENTSWLSGQMPIKSEYDHNYEVLSFEIDNPPLGQTDIPMNLLGSMVSMRPELFGGSIVGIYISRQTGAITSGGYFRAYPTINGAKAGVGFYASLAATNDPVASYVSPKGTFPFSPGSNIGVVYKTSAGYTGTGRHVVNVWISRDGVKH